MTDTLNIDGLEVGPCMVRGYIERIAELESELAEYKHTPKAYEIMEADMLEAEAERDRLREDVIRLEEKLVTKLKHSDITCRIAELESQTQADIQTMLNKDELIDKLERQIRKLGTM